MNQTCNKSELSRQQQKSMETKARIFSAAKHILQKKGYEQLSIKNICEEAGVSNGSFYHHFKTKDDLLSYYIEEQPNINPDLLTGASFTVSNVGSFGVESFTPVINPPQTGILGVDTITTRVRESGGELQGYPAMGLSLTYDHRAVDGAPASKFLAELKSVLEHFSVALCK